MYIEYTGTLFIQLMSLDAHIQSILLFIAIINLLLKSPACCAKVHKLLGIDLQTFSLV